MPNGSDAAKLHSWKEVWAAKGTNESFSPESWLQVSRKLVGIVGSVECQQTGTFRTLYQLSRRKNCRSLESNPGHLRREETWIPLRSQRWALLRWLVMVFGVWCLILIPFWLAKWFSFEPAGLGRLVSNELALAIFFRHMNSKTWDHSALHTRIDISKCFIDLQRTSFDLFRPSSVFWKNILDHISPPLCFPTFQIIQKWRKSSKSSSINVRFANFWWILAENFGLSRTSWSASYLLLSEPDNFLLEQSWLQITYNLIKMCKDLRDLKKMHRCVAAQLLCIKLYNLKCAFCHVNV